MSRAHFAVASSALGKLFASNSKTRKLRKGDLLIPYFDAPKCLFLVSKGSLSVSLSNAENSETVCVSLLKPGDMFGEQGLFDPAPMHLATASVEARCDVQLQYITHNEIRRAAMASPDIYAELSSHINARLSETTAKLLQLAFMGIEERCFQSLVAMTRLPEAQTHPDGMLVRITRIELSRMVLCSRETAGRALRALSEKSLIETSGRRVVVYGYRHGEKYEVSRKETAACV